MNRITRHLGRLWRARGGIASVEFVMIMPLMAVMLFGTIEIGRILFDYQAASKSVRDATRYLTRIRAGDLGLACPNLTVNNALPEVIKAKNLVLTGSIDAGPPYLLSYWTDLNSVSVAVSCVEKNTTTLEGLYVDATWIPSITVSATVPLPLMNGWLVGQDDILTFTVRHKETHFGQ